MIPLRAPLLAAVVALFIPVSAYAGESNELATGETALGFSNANLFDAVDSAVLIDRLPMWELMDGRRFPIASAIGRMGLTPFDLFPLAYLQPVELHRVKQRRAIDTEPNDTVAELRSTPIYTGGEVGVFYGKSTGKYGGEEFGSYMVGTIATDKFQVTAGASYQESSFRFPRGR